MGSRRHVGWYAAFALVPGLAAVACGDVVCGDHKRSQRATAPRIEEVALAGHIQGDPWSPVFALSFHDSDGDLAAGGGQVYSGSSTKPNDLPLADLFDDGGIDRGATRGILGLALIFSDSVDTGDRAELGFQLLDGSGQRSNCYTVDLLFSVQHAAGEVFPIVSVEQSLDP